VKIFIELKFKKGGVVAINNRIEKISLMYQIAKLYYEQELTQEQIADKMGLTRLKIHRLLAEARRENIVQIKVVNPLSSCKDLEDKLIDKFALLDAIVVHAPSDLKEVTLREIGQAAAGYIRKNLRASGFLGLGWGTSVFSTVNSLIESGQINKEPVIVPLVGGMGELDQEFQINEMARETAKVLQGTWKALHTPYLVETPAIKEALFSDRTIREVIELWEKIDIALVGIGTGLSKSPMLKTPYFGNKDIMEMQQEGAMGDICSRFFNNQGSPCKLTINEKLIGIELEMLKQTPVILAVAEGISKIEAIKAAITGRLVNVLVTNETTANGLLGQVGQ
jgi:deoxyribonucleoside regulator